MHIRCIAIDNPWAFMRLHCSVIDIPWMALEIHWQSIGERIRALLIPAD